MECKNCEFTSCGCSDMIFVSIVNFDFRFGQEVKVKLGSPFCKYFLTINDLYNGAKLLNLPLAVVEIWFFLIVNFDFRFGQEVKVKLGSLFYKYFFTINDLYNDGKSFNLPLVVVEIWFFFNSKLWIPVWTGSKGQIGVTFL